MSHLSLLAKLYPTLQGELARSGFDEDEDKLITFTARPFVLPTIDDVRLVDDDGSSEVLMGRVEVRKIEEIFVCIDDEELSFDVNSGECSDDETHLKWSADEFKKDQNVQKMIIIVRIINEQFIAGAGGQ